jgi:hypothetical protein
MSIQFKPEPLADLRLRFPKSLERIYDAIACEKGGDRPGQFPEHVFDCPCGMRLIVSRETYPEEPNTPRIHVSGSHLTESCPSRLAELTLRHFWDLAMAHLDVEYIGHTVAGVSHYLVSAADTERMYPSTENLTPKTEVQA